MGQVELVRALKFRGEILTPYTWPNVIERLAVHQAGRSPGGILHCKSVTAWVCAQCDREHLVTGPIRPEKCVSCRCTYLVEDVRSTVILGSDHTQWVVPYTLQEWCIDLHRWAVTGWGPRAWGLLGLIASTKMNDPLPGHRVLCKVLGVSRNWMMRRHQEMRREWEAV